MECKQKHSEKALTIKGPKPLELRCGTAPERSLGGHRKSENQICVSPCSSSERGALDQPWLIPITSNSIEYQHSS